MQEETVEIQIDRAVRAALREHERELRAQIVEELKGNREFFQSTVRTILNQMGLAALAVGGLLTYLIGSNAEDLRSRMAALVDDKVIEYHIVESFKEKIRLRFQEVLTTKEITADLQKAIESQISSKLETLVKESFENINEDDARQTLRAVYAEEIANIRREFELRNIEVCERSGGIYDSSIKRCRGPNGTTWDTSF